MSNKPFEVKHGLKVAGITYPSTDGTNRQVITTDGSGILSFETAGETVESLVKNTSASTILKGTPVYQSGEFGSGMEIQSADASNAATMPAIGILKQDLTAGSEGQAIHFGTILGIDTSAYTAGATLYVAIGGGYTDVIPTGAANLIQNLGTVTKIHASNGGGVIMGSGRSNATPNLDSGKIFMGNASNQSVSTTLTDVVDPIGTAVAMAIALG